MEKEKRQKMWGNGALWVLANTFSWLLYIAIGMAAGWLVWETYQVLTNQLFLSILYDETNRMLLTFILVGVSWGAVIGFFQQLILKQRFDLDARAWISATCIGMTLKILFEEISLVTYDIRFLHPYSFELNILALFISSALLGTAQWVILRRTFKRAELWIIATAIALGITPLVLSLLNSGQMGRNGRNYINYTFILYLITGFVYSLATWISLILMSRQHAHKPEIQQG